MNQSHNRGRKQLFIQLESTGGLAPAAPTQTSPAGGGFHAATRERRRVPAGKGKVPFAKMAQIVGAIVLMTGAGAAGYYGRAFHEKPVTSLSRGALPAIEYFVSGQSFSEVEEAKTLLQASVERMIQEIRDRSGVGGSPRGCKVSGRDSSQDQETRQMVSDLERRIAEFKGTVYELALVREYLWLLSREEQPERFLEVYLSALYPHPTDELVGLFADKALRASRFLGREPEVLKAFEYVNTIPFEFAGKRGILAVLEGARRAAPTAPSVSQHAS